MKQEIYNRYRTKVFCRKTMKELYTLSGEITLTEKEAILMQIDLSTPEKIFLLENIT